MNEYVQIIRSVSQWSTGTSQTEGSIHSAYCSLIESAEHFIYIEVGELYLMKYFLFLRCWLLNELLVFKIVHFLCWPFCYCCFLLPESVFHFRSFRRWNHTEPHLGSIIQTYCASIQRTEIFPGYCCLTAHTRFPGTYFFGVSPPQVLVIN